MIFKHPRFFSPLLLSAMVSLAPFLAEGNEPKSAPKRVWFSY